MSKYSGHIIWQKLNCLIRWYTVPNWLSFSSAFFLTITIFLQFIFWYLQVSTFRDIVVLELCRVLPVAVLCHMVWWSARRFEAVNFFLAREAWTWRSMAVNDSSIPKRYVNHCKRGGIGMPIKVGGCSPTPSSLLVLPSETRPPPPQHLLLTLRGGALPFPLVAHSMYTIQYTIHMCSSCVPLPSTSLGQSAQIRT